MLLELVTMRQMVRVGDDTACLCFMNVAFVVILSIVPGHACLNHYQNKFKSLCGTTYLPSGGYTEV